jgi:murein L,D-transpeptidase YcbB/YkuD
MSRFFTSSVVYLFITASLAACNAAETKSTDKEETPAKSFTVTEQTAVTELFLDSATVEQFITQHAIEGERATKLRKFYSGRSYQFAWFNADGITQQATAFWNLHNNYVNYAGDSSFFNQQLHEQMKLLLNEDDAALTESQQTNLELELTDHFFDYAQYAYAGKIDPAEVNWHIPRKKINAISLLDSLLARNGEQLDDWEPHNEQYKQVRKELMRLYKIEKNGGWGQINADAKAYRTGDSSAAIRQLKTRLRISGDYRSADESALFTPELKTAVERHQKRFGLTVDGVVGSRTLQTLNTPVAERIKQLLVNMERMRWMPPQREGRLLMANIPEFRLHVYEGREQAFSMKIVVGKAANRTVVFNDQLKHVVFSPYWNIPRSIVRGEILPAMRRNPNYLARNNMEQTGTRGGLPVIRQKPGGSNALGRVKFLFPNSYNIYFHDTPAKSLFDQTRRAFSHGCIRLAEPKKLAAYLLSHREEWTDKRITDAMFAGREKWVTLEEPVPVAIVYFTAWVDADGVLNYRDDIYGHDKKMADHLFGG